MKRRSFLHLAANAGAVAALGDLGFLAQLGPLSAAEVKLDPRMVRLHPDLEPLVRLLEDTPRERLLEEVGARIKRGLTYREVVAALLLAGVRNIQPRPVGFKFHAVLVINSAHLASLASPDSDRWLPLFWALDQFKISQAADEREGDWMLGPPQDAAVPASHRAKSAFIQAMDNWDEAAADAAITGLARTAGAHEIFEILCRYGARDFRDIGHKQIYLANSFRALEVIGWQHAEPVLRSLVYGMLDRSGAPVNPAQADLPADRPFRSNLELVKTIRPEWLDGRTDTAATADLLHVIREGSPEDTSRKAIELLNRGVAAQSLFDAFFAGAGERLMRVPGILALHATTFANALHYSWTRCRDGETRRLLLLQNAAFLPLYRGGKLDAGVVIDHLSATPPKAAGGAALDEILAEINGDRLTAAGKLLAWLRENPDPAPFIQAARRLIFLKGRDSHDYKFSEAVLEDYHTISAPWRDRVLAASVFHLKGSGEADNDLVRRTRGALAAG